MGKGILATSIMPRVQFGIMKLYRCVAENKMKAEFEDGCKGADSIRVSEEGSINRSLSVYKTSGNSETCPTQFPRAQDDISKLPVLSDGQPKIQRYFIGNNIKKKKLAHSHIKEA